ncbi:MAG: hypothetical protein HY934_09035 [Candidatus Firestonebacteria bacterium]|nr:hypothetical protein [Candidatus Firestonebacteria bacterium]
MGSKPWLNYIALGFIVLSIFIYEILLVRIFAVLFIYKILFLIISIAILGLGTGGIFYEWYLKKRPENKIPHSWIFAAFSLSFSISLILLIEFYYVLTLPGCIAVTTIPFFLGGIIITSFYTNFAEKSSLLYLADLLGGVAGCLLSLVFVYYLGIMNAVITASIINIVPFFIIYHKKTDKIIGYGIFLLISIFLFANLNFNILNLGYKELKHADTPLGYAINYPRFQAEIMKTRWDIYSRCDLTKIDRKDKRRAIFINGGTQAIMMRYKDESSARKDFAWDITGFPYRIGPCPNVLILGSGGGRDVRMALLYGAEKVTAVEINKTVVDMTKDEREYNGGIYYDPRINLKVVDGRNFIMQDTTLYDRIVLSLATTHAFSDIQSISQFENYLFTQEAITEYFNHLKDDGMLVFLVDYEQIMTKFVISSLQYLETLGIPVNKAVNHILVLKTGSEWSAYSYILMAGKKSIGYNIQGRLIARAEDMGLEPVIFPNSPTGTDFDNIAKGNISLQDYIKKSPYNISGATDDSPYFMEVIVNYRKKLSIFLLILISIILIITGIFIFNNNKNRELKYIYININVLFSLYFLCIGIAFMLVEIALLKRFSFYLGYPELNLVIILSFILLSSGLGSFTTHFINNNRKKLIHISIVLVISILLSCFSISLFIKTTAGLGILWKIVLVGIFLFPVCFFMGMPLPIGLKLIKNMKKESDIPFFWGINGLASVSGSILAVILSMSYGFTLDFIAAAVLYCIIGIISVYIIQLIYI